MTGDKKYKDRRETESTKGEG
ncbi:hypothetical protein AVEN_267510-1, partial [Araneus ventricosus]